MEYCSLSSFPSALSSSRITNVPQEHLKMCVFPFFKIKHECLYMCLYDAFAHVCAGVPVYRCAWRSEEDVRCIVLLLSTLLPEDTVSH